MLAQKPRIVPIPGTTKLRRLTENTGGAAVDLPVEDVKAFDKAFAATGVQGERYPSHLQKPAGK